MIRYLSHTEINRLRWDECISGSAFETLYAYSWYLDMVSPGWYALIKDDYEAVMPLTWKRKYGVRMLLQPLLAQQLGIFSRPAPDPDTVREFIRAISPKYLLVDICLNRENRFESGTVKQEIRHNYEMDVGDAGRDLAEGYSSNTIRNLRKGQDYPCSMDEISLREYLDLKFSLKEDRIPGRNYMERLFADLISRGRAGAFGLRSRGLLHTAAILGYSATRTIYLNGCSSAEGREKRGMFAMIDHLIRLRQGRSEVFDFEGSNIPGVARFFSGFGAKVSVYPRITRNPFQLLGINA